MAVIADGSLTVTDTNMRAYFMDMEEGYPVLGEKKKRKEREKTLPGFNCDVKQSSSTCVLYAK